MIRLVDRKKEQTNGAEVKKSTAAQLRVQKDLSDLDLPPCCRLVLDEKDTLSFQVFITPDEGIYQQGRFSFLFKVSSEYPHEPPKVKCEQRIFHPNIDTQGNVCLNILRQEWKPILNISAVINGLIHLFMEPNPMDPLNKEAAEMLKTSPPYFQQTVRQTMRGVSLHGEVYDRVV